jgi:ferredoxin
MTYVVTEPCYNCKYTDCVVVCPVDAFREGSTMLFIDPEICIDCNQCVPECPVNAIFPEDDVPEKWEDYIALNADMAPNCPEITEKKDPMV